MSEGPDHLSDGDRQRWRGAIDPHDLGLLERRLAWHQPADSPLDDADSDPPAWWSTLAGLRAACETASAAFQHPPRSALEVPFVDIAMPIVAHGWTTVGRAPVSDVLTGRAGDDLRTALARRLSAVLTPALAELFAAERSMEEVLRRRRATGPGNAPSTSQYRDFCRRMLADGLAIPLRSYPVLGRLLAATVERWQEAVLELLNRLDRDRSILHGAFEIDPKACVARIAIEESDPHEGGRQVCILTFVGDRKVVYKPKDMRLELQFQKVVGLVNEHLSGRELATLRVICPADDYGYSEFAQYSPVSLRGADSFFHHAGILLALLHLLGASDCHYENLVAAGDQLLLVDAETLFEPDMRDLIEDTGASARLDALEESVLRVGLLPSWTSLPDGRVIDVSALGVIGGSESGGSEDARGGWRFVNTDDMVWSTRGSGTSPPPPDSNRLTAHVSALVRGFREGYRSLRRANERGELLRLIDECTGMTRRVVIRPTRVYHGIEENAKAAAALTHWRERMLRLEQLSRAYVVGSEKPVGWPLLMAEMEAVDDLDVPRFEQCLGSTDIRYRSRTVLTGIAADGVAAARSRLASMSEDDLAWQVLLIEGAVGARSFRMVQRPERSAGAEGDRPHRIERSTPAQIAAELRDAALRDARGNPTWLTAVQFGDRSRVQLGLIPPGLYDGRAGVAAFLYAAEDTETAAATLAPVLESLGTDSNDHVSRYLRDLGMGLTGIGGILRVCLFLSDLRPSDETWLAYALRILDHLPLRLLRRETEVDLLGGIAGLAKPLAALWRMTGSDRARSLLEAIGVRLCATRERGTGAWANGSGDPPLTGWAHGASGIATALAEIAAVTGSTSHRDALRGALGYERSTFDRTGRGWPDLRPAAPGQERGFMDAWCHGSAGISLSRMRLLHLFPDDPEAGRWRGELETGVELTLQAPLTEPDHLCCGNLGRALIAVHLGRRLGRKEWIEKAAGIEGAVLARRAREGGFRTLSVGPKDGPPAPGLMTGLAGIGMYELFRAETDWVDALLV